VGDGEPVYGVSAVGNSALEVDTVYKTGFCTETLDNESMVRDFSNSRAKEEKEGVACIEEVFAADIETQA
jgi:hypothetical protein